MQSGYWPSCLYNYGQSDHTRAGELACFPDTQIDVICDHDFHLVRGQKGHHGQEKGYSEEEASGNRDMALQDQRMQQAVRSRGRFKEAPEDYQASFYARIVRVISYSTLTCLIDVYTAVRVLNARPLSQGCVPLFIFRITSNNAITDGRIEKTPKVKVCDTLWTLAPP